MSENVHIKRKVTLKEKQSDTNSSSTPKKWPKIVIPIVVVAIIAVVAFLVWPNGDKTNEEQIAQNTLTDVQSADTQGNTTATDNAADNSVGNENQTAEQAADEVSAPAEEASETTETVGGTTEAVETTPTVAQPAVNNTTPKPSSQSKHASNTTPSHHTSGTLTGDVEEDAKAVIRGEFGNGDERKAALGDSYTKIQNRVNEIYKTNGGF